MRGDIFRVKSDTCDGVLGELFDLYPSFRLCSSLDLQACFGSNFASGLISRFIYPSHYPFSRCQLVLLRPCHELIELGSEHVGAMGPIVSYGCYGVAWNLLNFDIDGHIASSGKNMIGTLERYLCVRI